MHMHEYFYPNDFEITLLYHDYQVLIKHQNKMEYELLVCIFCMLTQLIMLQNLSPVGPLIKLTPFERTHSQTTEQEN